MGLTEKSFLERNEEMGIFKTDCNVKSNQSDDLISRKAAIKEIESIRYCGDFISALIHLPAVDAAPVRHGHWIYKERHRKYYRQYTGFDAAGETHTITVLKESEGKEPYCSECGAQAAESFMDFCPRCGANMDGK